MQRRIIKLLQMCPATGLTSRQISEVLDLNLQDVCKQLLSSVYFTSTQSMPLTSWILNKTMWQKYNSSLDLSCARGAKAKVLVMWDASTVADIPTIPVTETSSLVVATHHFDNNLSKNVLNDKDRKRWIQHSFNTIGWSHASQVYDFFLSIKSEFTEVIILSQDPNMEGFITSSSSSSSQHNEGNEIKIYLTKTTSELHTLLY